MELRRQEISKGVTWLALGLGVVYTLVTLLGKPTFALTVFGDIAQLLLSLLVLAAFALPILSSSGRVRSFWILMTAGVGCWFVSQALWSYYEIICRIEVVDPSFQDIVLFLHLIPMMAALASLPHVQRRMPRVIPYTLGMLAVWWMYLYSFAVIPWQYVAPDFARYGGNFNALYSVEDFTFIFILARLAWHANGAWRTFYRKLLLGSLGYTISALLVNTAINHHTYYTGSLYDVPLVLSMVCICWSAASVPGATIDDELKINEADAVGVDWLTRIAFVALLSVPILAAWALEFSNDVQTVRNFRVGVSLVATVALGGLLFVVQRILSRSLEQSLKTLKNANEELSRAREALQHQATHDAMTGALNRCAISEALHRELARAQRAETRVAVLLIDLDHFKDINDRFGHHAGDIAIIAACTRMQDCLRSHDLVGRYGGEEFLVIIPEADYATAMQIGERIRKHVSAEPICWQANEITVKATIGIALSRMNDNPEQLLRRADMALYDGKAQSRDTVKLAVEDTRAV